MNQDTMSLDDYFRNWEFSLFKTPPGFDVMHIRRMVFEEKYSEHGNYGAATVLLQDGDLEEAWNCVSYALESDPNSVHAWCNKGVYYLKSSPPQENEARLARDKMEELLQQDEAKKTAAIEYAYWQHNVIHTAQAQALGLFDRLLSNESTEPVIKHHYLYMKVLTSHAKRSIWNGNANMATEVQRSMLKKLFVEALVLLQANSPDYEVTVWHSLALVLIDKTCLELVREGFDEVKFLKQKYKLRTIDSMLCVKKILEFFYQNPTLDNPRRQEYSTIAKVYLKKARETENSTERWRLLKTALEYGEKYLEAGDKSPCFGSQVSSDILMQMWAMKYRRAEPEKARSAYREIFGNQDRIQKEVEAVFPRLDELETDEQKAAMLATYGRFCEISNRFQEAFQEYQKAA
ncbi:hypothetical protein EB796_022949 [Bugula neritina]|uniref:Uncharacterized protein n=1 Tax=Bugula neritina TaxID=10212 RepID=A0A7J7IY09_BUGNE|nr:hypothetical protein EB796_022949 [Bugula neritina]